MEFQNELALNPKTVADNLSHDAFAIRTKSVIGIANSIISEIESHPQISAQVAVQALLGIAVTVARRHVPGIAVAADEISTITGINTLEKASLPSYERALSSAIESKSGNAVKTARVIFDKDIESPIDLTGISRVTDAKLASFYWDTWSSTVRVENTNSRNEVLGRGTAFFVTKSGQLLTNFHVTAGGEKLAIIEGDGTRRAAF